MPHRSMSSSSSMHSWDETEYDSINVESEFEQGIIPLNIEGVWEILWVSIVPLFTSFHGREPVRTNEILVSCLTSGSIALCLVFSSPSVGFFFFFTVEFP